MDLTTEQRRKILKEIKTDKEESEYMIKELVDIDSLSDEDLLKLERLYSDLWSFILNKSK